MPSLSKKLSQHLHKKDGALNVAVVNVLISLVNGGWREGQRPADKKQVRLGRSRPG
jgi:hypothetical protein